jgi:peroxiredoxin
MMRLRKRWWIVPLLLVPLAAGLAAWRAHLQPVEARFTLLDSQHVTLQSLRGHPVLISFWATTCRPCLNEIPALSAFYRRWHPQGMDMIAVAMPYDPPWSVADVQQRLHIPYPVALDFNGAVIHAFGDITLIPTTVLLGPDGRERWRHTGTLDFARLRASMRAILKENQND